LTTTGPHGYQGTGRDAIKCNRADIFFINGLTLDDTLGKQVKTSGGHGKLRYVELGESLKDLIPMDHSGHEHHGHSHGEHDPHVWLGIPEAVQMVERIRDELKSLNPSQAAAYDKNAADYIRRLQDLHKEGKELLASKQNRKLITFHESLAYFARSFDLVIVGSIQAQAGVEPSHQEVARLTKKCKAEDVRVIAIEPQFPASNAQALLRELPGARTATVDTLETAPPDGLTPDYYERKMRENLQNLADALP
jgi:ABC-type Zn uptake system ZnuABC Zn-binding protein ZnuA